MSCIRMNKIRKKHRFCASCSFLKFRRMDGRSDNDPEAGFRSRRDVDSRCCSFPGMLLNNELRSRCLPPEFLCDKPSGKWGHVSCSHFKVVVWITCVPFWKLLNFFFWGTFFIANVNVGAFVKSNQSTSICREHFSLAQFSWESLVQCFFFSQWKRNIETKFILIHYQAEFYCFSQILRFNSHTFVLLGLCHVTPMITVLWWRVQMFLFFCFF